MVVGGGASGALAALHLSRRAAASSVPLTLDIVEPGPLARGVAYSTGNHEHRLNVPATGMSVLPDEPGHFVHWLRANYDPGFPAGGFAPRAVFGRYLADTLDRQLAVARRGRLDSAPDPRRGPAPPRRGRHAHAGRWPGAVGRCRRSRSRPRRGHHQLGARAAGPLTPVRGRPVASGRPARAARGVDRAARRLRADHDRRRHQLRPLSAPHGLPARAAAPGPRPDPPAAQPRPLPGTTFTAASARRLVFGRIRALDGDWRTAVDSLSGHPAALVAPGRPQPPPAAGPGPAALGTRPAPDGPGTGGVDGDPPRSGRAHRPARDGRRGPRPRGRPDRRAQRRHHRRGRPGDQLRRPVRHPRSRRRPAGPRAASPRIGPPRLPRPGLRHLPRRPPEPGPRRCGQRPARLDARLTAAR